MAGGYSLTISATDAASGVIDGVNKRIEALNKRAAAAWAPFKHLGDSVERFAKVSGIDKIAGAFGDVARTSGEAVQGLLRVLEPLAVITGAASLAGMYKLVGAWGQLGAQLGIQAARAGMTATSLLGLQNAAQLANVSGETLTQGMTSLTDNLRNAAVGAAPQFLAVLRQLGVSYDELKAQTPEQQVKTLASALGNVRNVTDRALFTKELFGGEGMLPFLNKGAAGIGALLDKAQLLGGVIKPADLDNLQKFNTAQEALSQSVSGFGGAIAKVLAPVLTPLLDTVTATVVQMRGWVEANDAWLRATIADELGKAVTWIKGVDWAGVVESVRHLVEGADKVAKALGGWQVVGEGLVTFFAGRFLLQMLAPFAALTVAIGKVGLAILPGLVTAFEGAGKAAEAFSVGAMKLPIFKAIALTATLFDQMSTPKLVEEMAADDPRRQLLPPQPQRDAAPSGPASWLPRGLGGAPKVLPITEAEAARNMLAMDRVFRTEGGLTRDGSAGLLGGFTQESGFNPRSGAGSKHQGIAQWSDERRALIEKQFGKSVMDMGPEEQARAVLWELNNKPEYRGINQIFKTSHDPAVTNNAATRGFERPGNYEWEIPKRLGYTLGALAKLPDGEPAPAPSGAPGAPGASGQVNMNVRVTGAPAVVTAQSRGDVNLNVATPGLVGP